MTLKCTKEIKWPSQYSTGMKTDTQLNRVGCASQEWITDLQPVIFNGGTKNT